MKSSASEALERRRSDLEIAEIRRLDHVMEYYDRHFAGHPRSNRDIDLLCELTAQFDAACLELAAHRGEFPSANAHGEPMATHRSLLAREHDAIRAAYREGPLVARASRLAERINGQLAIYRDHFAGQSRLSRRPGLLRRVIGSLGAIEGELAELVDEADWNGIEIPTDVGVASNRELISRQVARFRREAHAIEMEHAEASHAERIASLGSAATAIMAMYNDRFAGQSRDLGGRGELALLCDRLFEIETQMLELPELHDSETMMRNLDTVQLALDMYHGEYRQLVALGPEA